MKYPTVVCVTDRDAAKLARIVEDLLRRSSALEHGAEALHETLDAARIMPSPEIPGDVVTMNSALVIEDAAQRTPRTLTLVYPEQADPGLGRVSVLSPLGNALLGARVGDQLRLATPVGERSVRVIGLEFQPEAAGCYDL
jgi:regulator of nucleoside diphosphate kinase